MCIFIRYLSHKKPLNMGPIFSKQSLTMLTRYKNNWFLKVSSFVLYIEPLMVQQGTKKSSIKVVKNHKEPKKGSIKVVKNFLRFFNCEKQVLRVQSLGVPYKRQKRSKQNIFESVDVGPFS